MKNKKSIANIAEKVSGSEIGSRKSVRDHGVLSLSRRSPDDPMLLWNRVMVKLDYYFLIHGLTYMSGQRLILGSVVKAALTASAGTVTAVPLLPGLGKSTLIRCLLEVFAEEFREDSAIAHKLGGVIVVVEKTAEAYELEQLCNRPEDRLPVAFVVEAPNDFNLGLGKCMNGTATSFEECHHQACPDRLTCPLMQAAQNTQATPVLIMLHARYQRHMEDMATFCSWMDSDGRQRNRILLLVDELPPLVEEQVLDLAAINRAESALSAYKPSYQRGFLYEKYALLYAWSANIRSPYFKLLTFIRKQKELYGLISKGDIQSAGFSSEGLRSLLEQTQKYLGGKTGNEAMDIINSLMEPGPMYFAIGQDISLFAPRVIKPDSKHQLSTLIFSGTATLSPELSKNPDIILLPDQVQETYQCLKIHIQRGDAFNTSRSGLQSRANLQGLVEWLRYILPIITERHQSILAVTYKPFARVIWEQLGEFHSHLLPYIDANETPQPMLPYFGGLNGSNRYQASTCVLCLGLNRFEPREYISRALALDFNGENRQAFEQASETQSRLDRLHCVLDAQDITLARDIVQLVYRSALRRHGETQSVELWLLQPPNGVVAYLQKYFGDCEIAEVPDLPDCCRHAAVIAREYDGKATHAAALLTWLQRWDGKKTTPSDIRGATGLTLSQYKEARKHPAVQQYFSGQVITTGSGKNTVYHKLPDHGQATTAA